MSAVSLSSQILALFPITEEVEEEHQSYSCSICRLELANPLNLTKHMDRVHAPVIVIKPPAKRKDKSISCSFQGCNVQFTKKSYLTLHLNYSHPSETVIEPLVKRKPKIFSCSVQDCDVKFSEKDSLRKHLKNIHGRLVGEKK